MRKFPLQNRFGLTKPVTAERGDEGSSNPSVSAIVFKIRVFIASRGPTRPFKSIIGFTSFRPFICFFTISFRSVTPSLTAPEKYAVPDEERARKRQTFEFNTIRVGIVGNRYREFRATALRKDLTMFYTPAVARVFKPGGRTRREFQGRKKKNRKHGSGRPARTVCARPDTVGSDGFSLFRAAPLLPGSS